MTAPTIAISAIDASGRKRPVDPDTVAAYATIAEARVADGLSPIIEAFTVRPVDGGYRLVTGGHRLAMLLEIGFETLTVGVEVNVKEMGDDEALQTELFENLANAGLKQLDRALFLHESWRIAKEKRGETRGRKSKLERIQEDEKSAEFALFSGARWSEEAASRVGMSVRSVFDAVRIANALIESDAVADVRGTMLEDNQNELKQLVDIPADKRREAVAAIRSGAAKKVCEARAVIGLEKEKTNDPQVRALEQFVDSWRRGSRQTRIAMVQALGLELKKLVLEYVED